MELSRAKAFHYEHIFIHPPPTPQPERNPLEKVPWSKMIESCRKRNFLIDNGGVRHKFLSKPRAQKSSIKIIKSRVLFKDKVEQFRI